MPDPNEIRKAQRRAWAGLAAGWDAWDAVIMNQMSPVTEAIIDALGLGEGQRHLDIAAGTGEPGLTVAQRVPNGRVVLTDLSPEMLDVARRRSVARRLANVDFKVCSADALPFGEDSFDSVSVRFGYMFLPDMNAATTEFARVLRTGGRICSSVWASPDDNPWTEILRTAIAAEVPLAPPAPDAPGMFRCAAPGFVTALYQAAGLHDVREWAVPVVLVVETGEEFWRVMSEHVSLAVVALQGVDDATRGRIEASVIQAAGVYEGSDGKLRVPGLARCIAGRK